MTKNKYRKKLIEVALPLEAINIASAREKSIRHGHPSTLHLWWARRPLAACRAVLFASLVNDPDDDPMYGINEDIASTERANLFNLIEELVQWENSNEPRVINAARLEIARSIAANKVADGELKDDSPLVASAPQLPEGQANFLPEPPSEYTPRDIRFKMPGLKPAQVNHFLAYYAPPVLDPFAGGGSIPLEAQRLGLRTYASDLNPVPVLINKALIEIPAKFAGQPPVNPNAKRGKLKSKVWNGAEGLAEDIRYYGKWMRVEAEKRIGHLYPKVKITQEMVDEGRPDLKPYVGQELTVIAWLWARTMKSPNPAAKGMHVPLISSMKLGNKRGRYAWLAPTILAKGNGFDLKVTVSSEECPHDGTIGKGADICLITKTPISRVQIREAGMAGEMGARMTAIVCAGNRQRVYISPTNDAMKLVEGLSVPENAPTTEIVGDTRYLTPTTYGMTHHYKLFTNRQLVTLDTLCELCREVRSKVIEDGGSETNAIAIATYLALAIDRVAMTCNSISRWNPVGEKVQHAFGRQALSMVWDYPEANVFGTTTGSFDAAVELVADPLSQLVHGPIGIVRQIDARDVEHHQSVVYSTDPPYYDNVPYADLSDFFYVWLRQCLFDLYPTEFSTLLVPKSEELVADPHRQGGKEASREFFESGMRAVFQRIKSNSSTESPTTIYYAFKQVEEAIESRASTGWETMLQGLLQAGWQINGTWPIRTEMRTRMRNMSSNALASSVILVCRPRPVDAPLATRRDFVNALGKELPEAIKHLQSGNVAPVDLAQASIGPGMAVFSRYSKVVNADGSPMSVREALQLINQVLDESLAEQESDFDAETRFALKWFEQFGMSDGPYGDAETLSKAMAVSVDGIREAGIVVSKAGRVRLLKRDELAADWDPVTAPRLALWEVTQYLIRALESEGETGAADLLRRVGQEKGDIARELAYRLYQTCERKSLAKEAGSYNALVVSWPEISKLARQAARSTSGQQPLELTD